MFCIFVVGCYHFTPYYQSIQFGGTEFGFTATENCLVLFVSSFVIPCKIFHCAEERKVSGNRVVILSLPPWCKLGGSLRGVG